MIIGWMVQSGIVIAIVSVLIGAGISYFVTTKTQKRAWKREYSVKIAETVYGNLFKQIKSIIGYLQEKYNLYVVDFSQWKEFQQDHRYFMVDASFRARLDDFTHRLEEYSKAAVQLETEIQKIIMEETERVFRTKTNEIPQVQIAYMTGKSGHSINPNLVQCLVSRTHPIRFAKTYVPEATDIGFTLIVTSVDGMKVFRVAPPITNEHTSLPDFDRFWQACLERMKKNESYKFVTEENGRILEDAQNLLKELSERIEEPWRI
jgi:hypothetical protein